MIRQASSYLVSPPTTFAPKLSVLLLQERGFFRCMEHIELYPDQVVGDLIIVIAHGNESLPCLSRYAAVGGRTDDERAQSLDEPGIGPATAMRIELFLEQTGLRLRSDGATSAPAQQPSGPQSVRAWEQQALASRVMRWSARHAGVSTLTDTG